MVSGRPSDWLVCVHSLFADRMAVSVLKAFLSLTHPSNYGKYWVVKYFTDCTSVTVSSVLAPSKVAMVASFCPDDQFTPSLILRHQLPRVDMFNSRIFEISQIKPTRQ